MFVGHARDRRSCCRPIRRRIGGRGGKQGGVLGNGITPRPGGCKLRLFYTQGLTGLGNVQTHTDSPFESFVGGISRQILEQASFCPLACIPLIV